MKNKIHVSNTMILINSLKYDSFNVLSKIIVYKELLLPPWAEILGIPSWVVVLHKSYLCVLKPQAESRVAVAMAGSTAFFLKGSGLLEPRSWSASWAEPASWA